MGSGGDPESGDGCDKVDFLFIIDNSGSMSQEQSNLVANFPGFISTIQGTLDEAQDYHVMVIDTDAWVFAGCPNLCDSAEQCSDASGMCDFQDPACLLTCLTVPVCNAYDCEDPVEPYECEDVLGAGVVQPRGGGAADVPCNFSSGARFMDSGEPNLAEAFACAASVGAGSTDDPERPMEAMVQAVTAGTEASACNEGFLRDDAILVVTFITDENDDAGDGSSGTVEGWRSALIAAKNGDESAIVVLGLFGDQDQPNPVCEDLDEQSMNGAQPSPRLREFVDSWGDRGFAGSVCAESYQEFFADAVSLIDTTCEEFVPPEG